MSDRKTRSCNESRVLELISEQICELKSSLGELATKSDLRDMANLLSVFQKQFTQEIAARDTTISRLEHSVEDLVEAVSLKDVSIDRLSSTLDEQTRRSERLESLLDDSPPAKLPIDLAIVGSSIVRHVDKESVNPGKRNELSCMPGAKVHHVRREMNEVLERAEVDKLVVHVGGNNIPLEPPAFLAYEIIDMLRSTRMEHPNVQLYFSAILPRLHPCMLHGINQVNRMVLDACDGIGVKFIPHNAFASNGVLNRPLFAPKEWAECRPVHLNVAGVAGRRHQVE